MSLSRRIIRAKVKRRLKQNLILKLSWRSKQIKRKDKLLIKLNQ